MNIAVIGAGISGLSVANMLKEKYPVTVFEASNKPGGLIKCDIVDGHLYHRVGGHVFNSKSESVLNWFWNHFDKTNEFISANRNAKILFNKNILSYPIENSLYKLDKETLKKIINELLQSTKNSKASAFEYRNFKEYLQCNFGKTLCELYFYPYNQKIWNTDLEEIPMNWLEGKLPMPDVTETIVSNILKTEESEMVHTSFYYPKEKGSQFIVDKLASNLNIKYNKKVRSIKLDNKKLAIDKKDEFDKVIFTGNIKHLVDIVDGLNISEELMKAAKDLKSNGTTNVLCETDETDISWLYLPDKGIKAHRIIYTGNFSGNNNKHDSRKSCTVEFSGKVDKHIVDKELKKLPGNLKMLAYNYEPFSYVIQQSNTRKVIAQLKSALESCGIMLVGRFAEWEYYNMDKCIEVAINLSHRI